MSAERLLLTREQVNRAESGVGFSHPVLAVIEFHLPILTQLAEGYSRITGNHEQQLYIKENYGFLADALVKAGPYTLEPIDLIAIWSRAREVFPSYARYRLAGMVSAAYAIQGAENPSWRKFPRHNLETDELPEGVIRDRSGLLYVQRRLHEIGENLSDIDFYIYGTREPAMSHAFHLAQRITTGDEEAKKELEILKDHQETHMTPVLSELHENFGNGYTPLYWPIEKALKALQDQAYLPISTPLLP